MLCPIEGGTLIDTNHDSKQKLTNRLDARGGQAQLVLFLIRFAGAGKITCITIAQSFCYEFYQEVSIVWNDNTFLFTAPTGSAAALFGGQTIHDVPFLNGLEKNISKKKKRNGNILGY